MRGPAAQFCSDRSGNAVKPYHDFRRKPSFECYLNLDKGFSGCSLETIAGLKVALWLERVDLVGGDGRNDVNESIDDGSMPGQIEGRELLDIVGHVPGIQQGFIV